MNLQTLQIGRRVTVASLDILPKSQGISETAPFQPVFTYSDALNAGRIGTEGKTGTISRHAPGLGSFAWIVRHEDGCEAIYHDDELVVAPLSATDTAQALLNPAPSNVFRFSIDAPRDGKLVEVRKLRIEIYK